VSVDPQYLEHMLPEDIKERFPSSVYFEFDVKPYLQYLPELEAEIFWLIVEKKKNQKDIAALLNLSQPTVSYRFRRVIAKLTYLVQIAEVPVRELVDEIPFLKEREKNILFDLIFFINQEMIGRRYGIRQSSVKWIFLKTRRRLSALEKDAPGKWFHHLALILLLERNLGLRVLQEDPDAGS
jgi:DNA-directed RNA polymerase specialized sigma subunit